MHESTDGSKRQYNAVSFKLDKRLSGARTGGAAASATRGARRRTTSSARATPTRGARDCRRTTTTWTPNTRRASTTRRTGSSWRRSCVCRARRIRAAWPTRWPAAGTLSAVVELVSGSPLNAVLSAGASDANLGLFGGRQRPNLIGDPNTHGQRRRSRARRRQSRRAGTSTRAAFANPGVGPVRQRAANRSTSALNQFRKNIDLVFAKDTRFAGSQSGEIRFEILNLTNTAKFGNEVDQQRDQHVELRPHRDAGRVHADLAADVPLPVLARSSRSRAHRPQRAARIGPLVCCQGWKRCHRPGTIGRRLLSVSG